MPSSGLRLLQGLSNARRNSRERQPRAATRMHDRGFEFPLLESDWKAPPSFVSIRFRLAAGPLTPPGGSSTEARLFAGRSAAVFGICSPGSNSPLFISGRVIMILYPNPHTSSPRLIPRTAVSIRLSSPKRVSDLNQIVWKGAGHPTIGNDPNSEAENACEPITESSFSSKSRYFVFAESNSQILAD